LKLIPKAHPHGGHLCGNAHGNNFNFADRHQHHPKDLEKLPVTGHVNYYLSDCDPLTLMDIHTANPSGSFQHTIQKTVGPILTHLVRLYPSVAKMDGKNLTLVFFLKKINHKFIKL
jgi:hypothetical protein